MITSPHGLVGDFLKCPMVARENVADGLPTRPNLFGDFLVAHPCLAQLQNPLRNLGGYLAFVVSALGVMAILVFTILHVVFLCSQKEVGGIYATPVIATVADQLAFGNRPEVQFVGYSVDRERFSASGAFAHFPVSTVVQSADPFPALVDGAFVHLSPESNCDASVCISFCVHMSEIHHISVTMTSKNNNPTEKEGC